MVVFAPTDVGPTPRDYVQNHVVDGAYPGSGVHAIERDLVTELWFEDMAEMQASVSTAYYLANLRPDEPNFVDEASVAKMRVDPVILHASGTGPFKAFCFISETAAPSNQQAAGEVYAAWMIARPGCVQVVDNAVLPGPGGAAPFVDSVLEGWFTTVDQASSTVDEFVSGLANLPSAQIDCNRSFAVAAKEYDRAALIQLHLTDTQTA